MLNTSAYKKEFINMLRNKSEDKNLLKAGLDSLLDAYLAPADMTEKFRTALKKECLFRRYASEQQLDQADGNIIAMASTGTAAITADSGLYPEESDRFQRISYGSYKIASLCKLNHKFITDTKFDIEGYLVNEFARRFGRAEEKVLLTGRGNNEPHGLLLVTESISTAESSRISFDDVINLYFSLGSEYRAGAIWIMNDETALHLRTLKDQNGNYLWHPLSDSLLGKPVAISPYMPSINSGKKAILFCDLSYFWLLERQALTIKGLFELFAAEDQIGYAAYERLDGKLIRPEACRALTVA